MDKIRKVTEYAYIVMFVLAVVEAVRMYMDEDVTNDSKAIMFAGFAILAVAMFFLRRKQRLMIEKNKSNQEK